MKLILENKNGQHSFEYQPLSKNKKQPITTVFIQINSIQSQSLHFYSKNKVKERKKEKKGKERKKKGGVLFSNLEHTDCNHFRQAYSSNDSNRKDRFSFKIYRRESIHADLPRINKTYRMVLEAIKDVARTYYEGDFVHGSYSKILSILQRKSFRFNMSVWTLKNAIQGLKKLKLLDVVTEYCEDIPHGKVRFKRLVVSPILGAKYRHTYSHNGFVPYTDDLVRWGLRRAEKNLKYSKLDIGDHVCTNVYRSGPFSEADAAVLEMIFKFMHYGSSLKDSRGVRHVTFSYANISDFTSYSYSSVGRSLRKLEDLGIVIRKRIRNKHGVDCYMTTINFEVLAETCKCPEMLLSNPYVREMTNLRIICGKECLKHRVQNCGQNSSLVEDDKPKIAQYRYIKNTKLYSNGDDNTDQQEYANREPSFKKTPSLLRAMPIQNAVPTKVEYSLDIFKQRTEIFLKEASREVCKWYVVDNLCKAEPPRDTTFKYFPKDDYIDFICSSIYGDGSTLDIEPCPGGVVPDSRIERQWLAIRFGIHAVRFLSRDNFRCSQISGDTYGVTFASGDLLLDREAIAALSDLNPSSKLMEKDKFLRVLKRRIWFQCLERDVHPMVIKKIKSWLAEDPIERAVNFILWKSEREESRIRKEMMLKRWEHLAIN